MHGSSFKHMLASYMLIIWGLICFIKIAVIALILKYIA